MDKPKICMGCFAEWDENQDQCPWCGFHPEGETDEDSEGWKTGDVLEKRYLLGSIYLKRSDYVIWRVYDSVMDIKCFFLVSVGGSIETLSHLAWGFASQDELEKELTVLTLREVKERYVLIFSLKDKYLDCDEFLSWLQLPNEHPPVIEELTYSGDTKFIEICLKPDTVLAERYRIIGCLGIGGFGITYLCEDILLLRNVAVKEYFPMEWAERDENYVTVKSSGLLEAYRFGQKSFLKEVKLTARFIHVPELTTIYDTFSEYDTIYLVMEYLDGKSIGREIKERGFEPYSPEDMAEVIVPVLKGLEAVHDKKIVHSDISPGNIIRRSDGQIVLIDFGAAKYNIENQPVLSAAFLKQDYAAPEQYRTAKEGVPRDEGPWTDLYAIGATMYYLLTGHKPLDVLTRLSGKNTDLVSPKKYKVKLKKGWMKLIHACMEPERKNRIHSAAKVENGIQELLARSKKK